MAGAKIHSLDAIKHFRVALIKFAEAVNAALGNADSDVNRSMSWLEMEAKPFWQNEIRKRQLKLAQAQEALRMKVLYKNFDGTTPSSVDEQKAVHVAKQRLEIANQKAVAVQRYMNHMQKEAVLYKGAVQRFSTTIQGGTPVAIAMLGRVMLAIDEYLAANPESISTLLGSAGDGSRPAYLDFLMPVTRAEDEAGDKVEEGREGASDAASRDAKVADSTGASEKASSESAAGAESDANTSPTANQTAAAVSKEPS